MSKQIIANHLLLKQILHIEQYRYIFPGGTAEVVLFKIQKHHQIIAVRCGCLIQRGNIFVFTKDYQIAAVLPAMIQPVSANLILMPQLGNLPDLGAEGCNGADAGFSHTHYEVGQVLFCDSSGILRIRKTENHGVTAFVYANDIVLRFPMCVALQILKELETNQAVIALGQLC